ncbi:MULTISPECIES: chemotaxis protein CheW [unclassified Coleofasciculus]|uniref:chemotaxis protein CheW n=1 Tax=unclassified Coleofasciculus TaxID=2692782 RepID=UPI0018815635|nr:MULTISPECIES: chemotaxis protein CheW [unclassified Coleofasciculus]MBE9125835.1 chemotaxis protein CheW [Coleofasciculus sp. LEGE 07081]MBE9149153.1 chemotaxis protein CheW [Coleofasciculus sp. LEGE 07092]
MFDSLSAQAPLSLSLQTKASSSVPASGATEQFLRFHMEPDTNVLVPVRQVTEILSIPLGQVVPISHRPAWVMGVYNWRGEILWIVDIGHLIGLTPWYQQNTHTSIHTAIVLHVRSNLTPSTNTKSQMLGLVVNRVEDIEWCDSDLIQSPPSSSETPKLTPFLRGYWLKSTGEMLAVLDGAAIIASMPKV